MSEIQKELLIGLPVGTVDKPRIKSVTLRDVALHAGVDSTTVAKVLNKTRSNTRVSQNTRERVLQAAAELRYRPNAVARGLASRRMNTVGVVLGSVEGAFMTNPYVAEVLQGIFSASANVQYDVHIFTQTWRNAELSAAHYADGRADGLIVISAPTDSDMVPGLSALGLPLVVVSWRDDLAPVPYVSVDNEKGVRLAVEHLLSLGHRRIAFLCGDENLPSALPRRWAFEAMMQEAKLPVAPEFVVPGSYKPDTTFADVERLLTLPQPPTAIVGANEALATEAMRAALDMGVSVPDQLSVVGFGDALHLARIQPALTTVRDHVGQLGAAATRLLITQLQGHAEETAPQVDEPQLIVRDSTAPVFSTPVNGSEVDFSESMGHS